MRSHKTNDLKGNQADGFSNEEVKRESLAGSKNHRLLTRRELVVGIGGIGTLLACGYIADVLSDDENLLRPPGTFDERRFLGLCLRCDRCRSVCPQNCIIEAPVEDGLKVARTPKIDFTRGFCTFCGECANVCPTGAITHDIALRPHEIGIASIDQSECLAYNGGGCRRCADVCPEEAITMNEMLPKVNEDVCTGCGLCVKECPSASLRSFSGVRNHRGVNVIPAWSE